MWPVVCECNILREGGGAQAEGDHEHGTDGQGSNSKLQEQPQVLNCSPNITREIKSRGMRRAWHVARMGDRKVANNSASYVPTCSALRPRTVLPKLFARRPFLASKNNHGSSHLAHLSG